MYSMPRLSQYFFSSSNALAVFIYKLDMGFAFEYSGLKKLSQWTGIAVSGETLSTVSSKSVFSLLPCLRPNRLSPGIKRPLLFRPATLQYSCSWAVSECFSLASNREIKGATFLIGSHPGRLDQRGADGFPEVVIVPTGAEWTEELRVILKPPISTCPEVSNEWSRFSSTAPPRHIQGRGRAVKYPPASFCKIRRVHHVVIMGMGYKDCPQAVYFEIVNHLVRNRFVCLQPSEETF